MDKRSIRSALYYRLRWLRPILAHGPVRLVLRILGWSLLAAYFAFAALILSLRLLVLPNIGNYQASIERTAEQALGLPIRIGHIEASWDGLNPHLTLTKVSVLDRQGRLAFALSRVDSVLSWQTLWRLEPTLRLLAVEGPLLHVRRDGAGHITVAGVEAEGESDPRLAEWVLAQPHIRIRNATIVWEDALRQAPPLVLEDLQFGLDNRGKRHSFGLSAAPPPHLAARIDLRGEVKGNVDEALEAVTGRLFVELDYADLAGWRPWVDYPVDLPRGRGALRVWGDWNRGRGHVTADVALEDLRIRLARSVPELDLASMRGRLEGRYGGEDEWQVVGSKVELLSMDGIRVTPTDFALKWKRDAAKGRWTGSASANLLDLGALARLGNFLPLDTDSRRLLNTHQPEGLVADLKANWEAEGDSLKRYSLRARFDRLGLRAAGAIPGASGLTGEIDASERGGSLKLDGKKAGLDLPAIFPEPRVNLDELRARAAWVIDGAALDVRLDRLEFAGPDAAGSARGTYHHGGDGPGHIDMTAALSRADARAVWRYMPHAVNAETRSWLRRGLVSGTAADTRLVLKGDLRDFPFRDRSKGQFLVTTRAKGVRLDYAPGWPVIDGIDGDLSFGYGMRIEASRGSILGTRISRTLVEIPDFETDQNLLVKGSVDGPTAEFLRFIDLSPVREKIGSFTEEIRAQGSGHLDLNLGIPLANVVNAKVEGEFDFQNNQVMVQPGLPPLTQVNGHLKFTESSLSAPDITAQVLGGPMRLAIRNDADRVGAVMSGTANVREVRKHFDIPLLDHASGSAGWKGEVRVRRKSAEFVVESGLVGVSSSLPEPFGKTAAATLPLRIEKKTLAENHARDGLPRDQIRVSLGRLGEALVQRRQEGNAMVVERGAVAVGDSLPNPPEKGIAVLISQPRLDVDQWRQMLAGGGGDGGDGALPPGLLSQVIVKTPAMHLLNREYANVELNLRSREGGWQVGLSTREAAGEIFWRSSANGGWLQADFKRLAIPSEARIASGAQEVLDSLPGMDVHVADFALGEKRLGRLDLMAHNEAGTWHLDSLSLTNPEGSLKGKGQWHSAGNHRTRLNFELVAHDAGKLLDRLGYPGAVRRGTASLKGDLAWDGALTSIHYPSLTGDLSLAAAKGQFAKVDPGIGKLLGLLSLQSLPRRLSLDFRDIFSEGFAFDSIDAQLAVKSGMMRTVNDLRIDGPAARIMMNGQVDLRQETQDVLVTVQPEIGSVFSVGALLLAHPVVGATAMVFNKLLQNPIDKMFSFQYHISGSWSDPKMEKVGQAIYETAVPMTEPKAEEGKR